MAKSIIFTNTSKNSELEPPKPASLHVPDWYKNLESYVGGEKRPGGTGNTTGTVKRCMPVFDAATAGYIITLPCDVFISKQNELPFYEWTGLTAIEWHPVEQAPTHPQYNGFPYPKWMNPWAIKTPPGYSVWITQPIHRNLPFTILDGIVDTDKYVSPVNFPFTLNDRDYYGPIVKGTPIAQIIPFKRDSWKSSLGGEEELDEQNKVLLKLGLQFFDKYKNMFRSPKEYK